jgi:membrane-bound metal-dependent hydrolase YbcI (DUF457 family)
VTGRTHSQIAAAGALGTSVALRLPADQTAVMLFGALATASAPDYLEAPFSIPHRTWTHLLWTGLAVSLAFLVGLALAVPPEQIGLACSWSGGMLTGWWLHSGADACTDRGCWLWKRERQVLLPDGLRTKVYTIEKRKHWLTRRVTTTKRPSRGERVYFHTARLTTFALAGLQAVLLAHDQFQPPT